MRAWMLAVALCAAVADSANANVVEATHVSGGSYVASNTANGERSYQQWTVGELTCYVAKDRVNGIIQVVKQCRNGLLGMFHEMTKEEEAIIEAEIGRIEREKEAFKKKMEEGNAIMQSSMRSMNNQIQRSLEGMHNTMRNMQQMMQQQMNTAFARFG